MRIVWLVVLGHVEVSLALILKPEWNLCIIKLIDLFRRLSNVSKNWRKLVTPIQMQLKEKFKPE
jgi:hypothetical protein